MTKTTDLQTEVLTQVDYKNQIIGKISRSIAHNSPDKFYRTIYVIVKDRQNKILLQKRSSTKDLYPNCWDLSVGGHVEYGDSYLQTAVRELHEELGIKTSEDKLNLKGDVLVKLPNSNEFFNVFEYILEPNDTIKLSADEIDDSKWILIEELKESIAKKSLKCYPRPEQVIAAMY